MIGRKILSLALVVILSSSLISCDKTSSKGSDDLINDGVSVSIDTYNDKVEDLYPNDDVKNSINTLNSAKTVTVSKNLLKLNKSYSVEVDGVDFGAVDGKYINLTGDKLTLTDKKGNSLSSEKQIKRWNIKLNRLAEVYYIILNNM